MIVFSPVQHSDSLEKDSHEKCESFFVEPNQQTIFIESLDVNKDRFLLCIVVLLPAELIQISVSIRHKFMASCNIFSILYFFLIHITHVKFIN